jgi:hypothetical protein
VTAEVEKIDCELVDPELTVTSNVFPSGGPNIALGSVTSRIATSRTTTTANIVFLELFMIGQKPGFFPYTGGPVGCASR